MKLQKLTLAALLSVGVLGLSGAVGAQEGILYKVQAGNTNYCHMKFPAIDTRTLDWDRPVLKDSRTGDIIDFYGPCDFDPLGKQAVLSQKQDYARMHGRQYNE